MATTGSESAPSSGSSVSVTGASSEVADAVHRALTAPRPRTRHRVGVDAKAARWIARRLPDRAQDARRARLVGLPKRP